MWASGLPILEVVCVVKASGRRVYRKDVQFRDEE
jgi:hypothetical protein